jgi:hypothetical protein
MHSDPCKHLPSRQQALMRLQSYESGGLVV